MKKLFEFPKSEIERIAKDFPDEKLVKVISRISSTEDEMTCVVVTQIFLERMVEKLFELKIQGNFWKDANLKWQYRTQILVLNQLDIIDDKLATLLNNFQSLRNKFAHVDHIITEKDISNIATNDELHNSDQLNLACISLIMVLFGKESSLIDNFSETLGTARREN